MRHLDLFSGIGGFALAAQWTWGDQYEPLAFCEIDDYCQRVLKKHWPQVLIFPDIHDLRGDRFETVDLITGGFPCQPFSVAGKRRGTEDDRALWPQMFRVIKEARPSWVLGENVTGIINMELDTVLSDLEGEGYTCQPFVIPACGVNAPHRRNRVWIVGCNSNTMRCSGNKGTKSAISEQNTNSNRTCNNVADSRSNGLALDRQQGQDTAECRDRGGVQSDDCGEFWEVEPELGRVADGIPSRIHRLRGLGNAIVPQVAAVILRAIREIEETCNP